MELESQSQRELHRPLLNVDSEDKNRPIRDVFCARLYIAGWLLTLSFAVYAFVNMNDNAETLFNENYRIDPSLCPMPQKVDIYTIVPTSDDFSTGLDTNAAADNLTTIYEISDVDEDGYSDSDEDIKYGHLLKTIWPLLFVASGLGLVLGTVLVLTLVHFSALLIYFFSWIALGGSFVIGLTFLMVYNDLSVAVFIFTMCTVLFLMSCCFHCFMYRKAALLDLSGVGIKDNSDLVFFFVCANVVVLMTLAGFVGLGLLAWTNGKYEMNPEVDESVFPDMCINFYGSSEYCCEWKYNDWVFGYWVFLGFMMFWTLSLMSHIEISVVSSVITQWYFSSIEERKKVSITRPLKFALNLPLGSFALSSLVMPFALVIGRMTMRLKKPGEDEHARPIQVAHKRFSWATKFAVNQMAITGEGLFEAGRNATQMMTRAGLNPYISWYSPASLLHNCSSTYAVLLASLIALCYQKLGFNGGFAEDLPSERLFWLTYFCSLTIIAVAFLSCALVVSVLNTIFFCFAMDRNNNTITWPRAHVMFQSLDIAPALEVDPSHAENGA